MYQTCLHRVCSGDRKPPAAEGTSMLRQAPAQPADQALLSIADQLTAAGRYPQPRLGRPRLPQDHQHPGAVSEITISTSGPRHLGIQARTPRPPRTHPPRRNHRCLLDPGSRPAHRATHPPHTHHHGRPRARQARPDRHPRRPRRSASPSTTYTANCASPTPPAPNAEPPASPPTSTIWWESRTQSGHTLDTIAATIICALADTAAPS